MRKHFYKLLAVSGVFGMMAWGASLTSLAAKTPEVDMLVLENELSDDEVAVDIGWMTEQDKGQWIEDMGIAEDCNSLVLVLNNMSEEQEELPDKDSLYTKRRASRKEVVGNSRLYYFDKNKAGHWNEVFSINCMISGGDGADEDIYGSYRAESAFGSHKNPGSLVPYWKITSEDHLILDPDSEDFGTIVKETEIEEGTDRDQAVCLEEMKAYSNYGLILMAEDSGSYPALVINCQQSDTVDRTFGGIQLSEKYVRMLIQSIDENTRFIIAGDVEDLEGM